MKRALGAVVLLACVLAGSGTAQIASNPIPAPIVKKGIAVEVKELFRLPDTRNLRPIDQDVNPSGWARVSYVRDLPDGRRFVNDSRGFIYVIGANNQAQRVGVVVEAAGTSHRFLQRVLAGVAETARLDAGHYGPEASRRVYEVLLARARRALAAGHGVILDAVFAAPGERQAAEHLARELGVPFHGLWLKAGAEVLKSRVVARRGDASDADAAVVERQLGYDLGAISWQEIEACPDAAIVLKSATALLVAANAKIGRAHV